MPAQAPAGPMKQGRWSDPASWPNGKVPVAGEAVTIARDRSITLDVSPPALRSLTINGKLSFANDRDLSLTTEWIYVPGGELQIGSEAKPFTHKATITLTDTVPNEDINTMGDRGIMLLRGTLNLHGDRTNSWTRLAKTAKAGSATIQVLNAAGWRRGDVIVLPSTDFNPRQAEERTISAISGNTLTLDKPLTYMQLWRDHLRGRRARRSRSAHPQHQDSGLRGRGEDLFWRPYHGDGGLENVCRQHRAQPHGPAHAPGALSDPLAPDRRGRWPVCPQRLDPRHLQPLRDGARHK